MWAVGVVLSERFGRFCAFWFLVHMPWTVGVILYYVAISVGFGERKQRKIPCELAPINLLLEQDWTPI